MKTILTTLALVAFLVTPADVSSQIHTGTIVNAKTKEPIGGASIRIVGTTRGTYTRPNGTYRLPLTEGASKLLVRSIGYEEITMAVKPPPQNVELVPSSVGLRNVEVIADITPEGLIQRAIDRVEENNDRISTLESTVFSKMRFRLTGDGIPGFDGPDESIIETFSKIYEQRGEVPKKHVKILQRRQTANIPAANNLLVFDNFFDFTRPEYRINYTRLVTPLAPDALDTYTYEILSKRPLGDLWVYEVSFTPTSSIFPGFVGTLSIVEGTYQVIAAKFQPTDQTSIPFLKNISYTQRYEQLDDSLWVPMYQEVTGAGGVDVIAGLIEIAGGLEIETWVTDVKANHLIADTLLEPPPADSADSIAMREQRRTRAGNGTVTVGFRTTRSVTTVADDADSAKPEFWEKHSFAEQTEEEVEAYRQADSIVQASPKPTSSDGTERIRLGMVNLGPIGVNVMPVLDRSTISGVMGGFELEFLWDRFALSSSAAFSPNTSPVGKVGLSVGVIDERRFELTLNGNVFSRFSTLQPNRSIFGQVNFLNLSNLFYASYSDYYRQDGFDVGMNLRVNDVGVALTAASARHIVMPYCETLDREAVLADAGTYNTLNATVSIAKPTFLQELFNSGNRFYGSFDATVGQETISEALFARAEVTLGAWIETFTTGYNPMRLDVDLSGGMVFTDSAPRQYEFSVLRRFPVVGTHTNSATAQVNAFGGTEYIRAHFEHNFSDVWWRAIGLPTFKNNRGVDLIGIYDVSNVWNRGTAVTAGRTWDATGDWYQEAGFAVGRIPTFISDLIYLRFDALWPVGGLAPRGTFGWSLTVSSPML